MSILVLLPVFILIIGALAVIVITRIWPEMRSTWLIVTGISLVVWLLILAMRWLLPPSFVTTNWLPFNPSSSYNLIFIIDEISWPTALSLSALLLAVFLTGSVRLRQGQTVMPWAGSLGIAAAGLLAVFSGSPLALLLSWTAIDIVELIIILSLMNEATMNRQAVLAFSVRIIGTMVAIGAFIYNFALNQSVNFDSIHEQVVAPLLIATGLRLGVLPLNLPYTQELPLRRGVGTMLRMVASVSSLVLLPRLPASLPGFDWSPYLMAFTLFGTLYGAFMWFSAEDEITGRPYWLIAVSGLAIACVILGNPAASIAWTIMLALSGGLLFLFTARQRWLLVLPIFSILAASGLPLTPTAPGWIGLAPQNYHPIDLFFVVGHGLLLAGLLRHSLRPGEPLDPIDRWVTAVYPLGLSLLVINYLLILFLGTGFRNEIGPYWFSIASILLGIGFFTISRRSTAFANNLSQRNWFWLIGNRIYSFLSALFRLDWLYRLLWIVYGALQKLVHLTSVLLEGQGGVLWALLLLALLFSIITAQSVQQ